MTRTITSNKLLVDDDPVNGDPGYARARRFPIILEDAGHAIQEASWKAAGSC